MHHPQLANETSFLKSYTPAYRKYDVSLRIKKIEVTDFATGCTDIIVCI